jgi:hypothetical protein
VHWLIALIAGRPADVLHRFYAAYVRYLTHLCAYLWLVAAPYPPFDGRRGEYPVEAALPRRTEQSRWKTSFRGVLAVPGLMVLGSLGGPLEGWSIPVTAVLGSVNIGVAGAAALLGWFASVATGRMPKGLRDAGAYVFAYQAQVLAYVLLLTDAYPDANSTARLEGVERPPTHPVRLVGDPGDLRRSRVTVFFRLPLAVPHIVWALLWLVAVLLASIVNWAVAVVRGRPIAAFHHFVARWVRYRLHLTAFLFLAANPFPGFVGKPGYPLDVELPEVAHQNRWTIFFRGFLTIPAFVMNSALGGAAFVCAVLMWFVGLFLGRVPEGLRNLAAYALRYDAQTMAYWLLVTAAYPHASPLEGAFVDE